MRTIYGRKPVLEAIKSDQQIEQINLQYGSKGSIIQEIIREAKRRKIKVSELGNERFKKLKGNERSQGVIAFISDLNYLALDELVYKHHGEANTLLLLLDSIQDPQNLGAILRSAECTGCDGVVLTTNNSAPISETTIKTSAGAVNHLDICKVTNLNNAIDYLKSNGYWVTGTQLGGGKKYTEVDYSGKVAIVMGNEEKGIHRLVAEKCDNLVEIPMIGNIQSLNVSVATGVMLFEVLRQRNNK